ncbi:hypothetical protein B4119_0685 [Parageobacillus caldoxylosilyticus]|uniref:Uncharacterized protein n=1 Tax=Saccharococcus caldoxylosilyticus TaxID=81408 RepID=A0A150L3M2_9BACL|nr:hypothetical protein B4119_0685 [Parageobacillus caldoxylosilyticus]
MVICPIFFFHSLLPLRLPKYLILKSRIQDLLYKTLAFIVNKKMLSCHLAGKTPRLLFPAMTWQRRK